MDTSNTVNLSINRTVFNRLQAFAEPLVDDNDSLLTKLMDAYELAKKKPATSPAEFFVSARGEQLAVGTKLRANYKNKILEGEVTASGIFYASETFESPSAAATYAKTLEGLDEESANTNGWKFWEYLDEDVGKWLPLDALRNN